MSTLYLTIQSAKRIQARTYNNVRLLEMKELAQRHGLSASISGDKVTIRSSYVERLPGGGTRTVWKWQGVQNMGQLLELLDN